MQKRLKNRAQTEAHILQAVEHIINKHGIQNLSISQVVKQAQVARSLVYRYFNNLDGLLEAYGNSRDLWPSIDEIIGIKKDDLLKLSSAKKLNIITQGWSQCLQRRPQTLAILAWSLSTNNALTQLLERQLDKIGKQCRRLLRSGQHPVNETDADYDFEAIWLIVSAAKTFIALRQQTQERFGGMNIQNSKNQQRISQSFEYIGRAIHHYQQRD